MVSLCAFSVTRLQVLVLGVVVLAAYSEQFYANRYGKRQEFAHGQAGFQSGSRYGRSDPDTASLGPDDRLQRRFYANGRYGKRANPGAGAGAGGPNSLASSLANNPEYQLTDDSMVPYVVDEDAQTACRYTGVANLYRCARRKDGEELFGQDASNSGGQGNAVTGNPLN